MTADRVVLQPELSYTDLATVLVNFGWAFRSGPKYPPLVAGEPEFAVWGRDGDATLVYTCNPVVWLRILDLSAAGGAADRKALVMQLPLLGPSHIGRLLRSRQLESALLGILATDTLGTREHLPAVRALLHHRERAIAVAARQATIHLASKCNSTTQ